MIFCYSILIISSVEISWQDIDFTKLDELIESYISSKLFPGIKNSNNEFSKRRRHWNILEKF